MLEHEHTHETQGSELTPHSKTALFREIIEFAIIAFLIVVPIRLFIAQPFIVQGASMQPSFETGQYLIVDQLSYHFEEPERGEVIIFRHPRTPSTFLIKRIIGLPGETVSLTNDSIRITSEAYPEGFIVDEPYITDINKQNVPMTITLDDDEYFVLGDNRSASSDSRVWGPLEEHFIVGKAFLRLFPFTKTDIFPGDYNYQTP
jgi:signal peptidase I